MLLGTESMVQPSSAKFSRYSGSTILWMPADVLNKNPTSRQKAACEKSHVGRKGAQGNPAATQRIAARLFD